MSSIQELRVEAYQVLEETREGGNTATRIGTLYNGIIDFLAMLDDRTIHPYDDTPLREAIDRIDEAIAELNGTLTQTVELVNLEKIRLDELINNLDERISDKVSNLLNDADWLEDHAEGIQEMVNEGEISWKSGWNSDVDAYLQEVGVWARDGDITRTQWTTIVQSVNEISTTVAEVQEDLAGIPTSLQWTQTTQKVNSIEASVNALLNDGQISEALQSSINLSIDGKISSLNLETTYAKIDTESAKDVLEWIYSALRNETTSEKTYSEIVSAGKSGLLSGISNVHTYVEVVRNGEVLDYVAGATLEAKVNDAITGLYSKASSGDAQTTIFSQVKKDTEDIATIVTHATGDYTSASIATKFDTWKAGLALKTDIDSAKIELLTAMDDKDAASALILEQKIDAASATLISRMNSKMAGFLLKTDLGSAFAEMVAADEDSGAVASIVAKVNRSGSEISLNADKINMTNAFVEELTANTAFINYLKGGTAEFDGKIIASSGSIGGFTISSTYIGSASQSDIGEQMYLSNSFARFGGNTAYVLLGSDVAPGTAGGAFTMSMRIQNAKPAPSYSGYTFDTANYGIYVDVKNGTKNYGLYSTAAVRASCIYGDKVKELDLSGSTYKIDLSQYNVFLIKRSTSTVYTCNLPNEASIKQQFGYSSLPSDPDNRVYFGIRFTLIVPVQSGAQNIKIADIYDYDGNLVTWEMSQGDTLELLCTNYGGTFRYLMLSYEN